MKHANILKEVKITHLVVSALLFLAGILMIAWADIAVFAVRCLVGIGFLVIGAVRILGYFTNDLYRLAFQYDLAAGALSAILGILILMYPDNLMTILPFGVGIYVLLDALLKLQTAFDAKVFGMRQWIGLLVSSAVVGCGGVALLIAAVRWDQPTVLIGIAIALDGAENFWNTMATVRVRAKKENRYADTLDGGK